jgi:maltose O-acetyltransferase
VKRRFVSPLGALQRLRLRLQGVVDSDVLVDRGLQLGRDVYIGPRAIIDPWHCWLITLEDEATIAPGVHLLAHDASTKRHLGWTRIGRIDIGRRAFLGAGSIVLPNTTVGDDAIVGAGSVVRHDIPPGAVAAGNPARPIARTEDYIARHREAMQSRPRFPWRGWTMSGGISAAHRQQMRDALADGEGYVE